MAELRKCCPTPKGHENPHADGCLNDPARVLAKPVQKLASGSHYYDATPDWSRKCMVCGSKPVFSVTGMCGPCTFGESSTAGGNW